MRLFFEVWIAEQICHTLSGESPKQRISSLGAISQTVSAKLKVGNTAPGSLRQFDLADLAQALALPWSAYACLLSVKDTCARHFYGAEALLGGWSVRQIESQLYEPTALTRNKVAMLTKDAVCG